MAQKELETRNFKEYSSNVIQENVKQNLNALKRVPFLDGIHLRRVKLYPSDPATSINKIPHKLFRIPIGYIITLQTDNSVIYYVRADKDTITLISPSVPQFADIWIF